MVSSLNNVHLVIAVKNKKRVVNALVRSLVPQSQEEMEIEICEAGTYSPGGSDHCTPCEKGTYAAKPGAPACYNCPKGHMCPQTNVEPEQCPIGTYNLLTCDKHVAVVVPRGKISILAFRIARNGCK